MNHRLAVTDRSRLRRASERGHYDLSIIHSILDATPLCHIGFVQKLTPRVLPSIQWREDNRVYWHASNGGQGIKAMLQGQVCLTVTLLDSLVLARSAFHHSVDFRSVMVFGQPVAVTDHDEKQHKLNRLIDHLYPGRSKTLRPITEIELKQTAVLSLDISEASAKIRDQGVVDDEDDYSWPVWAGVLPIKTQVKTAVADSRNLAGIAVPEYIDKVSIG